ncbi:MAG: preprotein translocase subunit YajC [Bacteriovoracaceae bacterium]|jgi:preprotein translocase subunit YajC|nr:preprotein translocase subunit YajC [Bacteriovoracaceae bacterium]
MISIAHAQDAVATGAPAAGFMSFVPMILIFFVFYFLMLRPQKKKMEEEKKFVNAIKKGDEVFTKSGILGVVQGVTETLVTLEVEGGVKFKMLKNQIAGSSKNILNTEKK